MTEPSPNGLVFEVLEWSSLVLPLQSCLISPVSVPEFSLRVRGLCRVWAEIVCSPNSYVQVLTSSVSSDCI